MENLKQENKEEKGKTQENRVKINQKYIYTKPPSPSASVNCSKNTAVFLNEP